MANKHRNVLYTGMTNNLGRRVSEHKERINDCFSKRYNVDRLVYFEIFNTPLEAIRREKQIKAGPRWRKVRLIEALNPEWNDLAEGDCFGHLVAASQ